MPADIYRLTEQQTAPGISFILKVDLDHLLKSAHYEADLLFLIVKIIGN